MTRSTIRRHGITLVELIVVLAIISVVIGIFVPAVGRVREAARETVCKNNLRQINLVLLQKMDLGGVAPTNPMDEVGGWAIELLSFLEEANTESAISSNVPLNQLDRRFFQRLGVYECPSQIYARPTNEGAIDSAHYILLAAPSLEKRGGLIAEAPLTIERPWVSSPEMTYAEFNGFVDRKEGPHYGGFYFVSAWQHGVEFKIGR